jgi:hypothetical protein
MDCTPLPRRGENWCCLGAEAITARSFNGDRGLLLSVDDLVVGAQVAP